jgi:hypothetical protein
MPESAYADDRTVPFIPDDDVDAAAMRRELAGVVQQVFNDLSEADRVAVHAGGGRRQIDREGLIFFHAGWAGGVDHAGEDRIELDRLFAQPDSPARHASDVQKVVDEANEMVDLALHHLRRGLNLHRAVLAAADRPSMH